MPVQSAKSFSDNFWPLIKLREWNNNPHLQQMVSRTKGPEGQRSRLWTHFGACPPLVGAMSSCSPGLSSRLKQCFSPHRYGGGSFSFSNLINGVTKRFSSDFELQQVRDTSPASRMLRACLISACCWRHFIEFFCCFCQQLLQFKKDNAQVGFGSGTLALDQSIERTQANIKWITENKQNVLAWFEEQTKGLPEELWLGCVCPFRFRVWNVPLLPAGNNKLGYFYQIQPYLTGPPWWSFTAPVSLFALLLLLGFCIVQLFVFMHMSLWMYLMLVCVPCDLSSDWSHHGLWCPTRDGLYLFFRAKDSNVFCLNHCLIWQMYVSEIKRWASERARPQKEWKSTFYTDDMSIVVLRGSLLCLSALWPHKQPVNTSSYI